MSKILCIIDGMTDPSFCADAYPSLSAMRLCGSVRTVPPGCAPESLSCILTLLGIKHIPPFLRGYVEALGAGISVQQDDLVLRASWFAVVNGLCASPVSAPDRLKGDADVAYYCLGGYKSLLVLPRMADCVESISTYPFYSGGQKIVGSLRPAGNDLLERIFDENCSNGYCMVPWGQSRAAALPPFPLRAAVISGTGVVHGLARLLNMNIIHVPGATGDVDTDLAAKTNAALQAAQDYPFVLLHINGADEAAHRYDPEQKKSFLTIVDRLVIKRLLHCSHTVFVTADHSTDPMTGLHGGTVQPVLCKQLHED